MGCKFIFPHHDNREPDGEKACKKSAANAMKCVDWADGLMAGWLDIWLVGWLDDWMNGWLGKGEALRRQSDRRTSGWQDSSSGITWWLYCMLLARMGGGTNKVKGAVLQQKQGLLLTLIYATFVKRIQSTCWSVIATTAARRLWVLENNIVLVVVLPAALLRPASPSIHRTQRARGR